MQNWNRTAFSRIRPEGWMREAMSADLEKGFVGRLDELLPDLIVRDDIFGKDRRNGGDQKIELGIAVPEEGVSSEYQWWNAETQSNWLDGFYRTAALVGSPQMKAKAERYVQARLATQDSDGYLGIYGGKARFGQGKENGELWAQSGLFRTLLAYYEETGDSGVLEAVVRAARLVMERYPQGKSCPFSAREQEAGTACGGLAHGLTVIDSYYLLSILTGDHAYLEYAAWLYDSASEEQAFQSDARMPDLRNPAYRFHSHGVQTYEHLRAVTLAHIFAPSEAHQEAFEGYLHKLEDYLCPSGGPCGDEWIRPEGSDATLTGYEYCSIQELLHSYAFLLETTGEMKWADRMERLFLNAALGAHHPRRSSITYLKTDNCYELRSVFQMPQPHVGGGAQTRYKYSPTHQDVAACCVPNAGRVFPTYLQASWFHGPEGFWKTLYGAGTYEDQFQGVNVRFTERSHFPANGKISLLVETESNIHFQLFLRRPQWCGSLTCSERFTDCGDVILLEKDWEGAQTVELEFSMEPAQHMDRSGDLYYTYGPLVLALPIPGVETIVKKHPLPGFYDVEVARAEEAFFDYRAIPQVLPERRQGTADSWFGTADRFTCPMRNAVTGQVENVELVPLADTVLRRVTFPLGSE